MAENGNGTRTEIYLKDKGILIRSEIIEVKNYATPIEENKTLPLFEPPQQPPQTTMYNFSGVPRYHNNKYVKPGKLHLLETLSEKDQMAIRELVVEYFNEHKELLKDSGSYNPARWAVQRQLAENLGVTSNDIRTCLRDAGLVEKYAPQIVNGAQYYYVYEHLDEMLAKYETIKSAFIYEQPRLMGVPHFYMDIMFYLAGMFNKVSKTNYHAISKRVTILDLQVRGNLPIASDRRIQRTLF